MNYDRSLTISIGTTRDSLIWNPSAMTWSELVERLRVPLVGTESHAAYMRMGKPQQDKLKDVGGFLGGALKRGRRKINEVTGRDLVTLDLDAIPAGGTDDVLFDVDLLGCAACVYSTRKHDADHPRLRVILPLSRTASAEEYQPLSRKLAEKLGIEKVDPTCFRLNQMMYWPNVSVDSEYVYEVYDKPLLDPDTVLAEYKDWHNAIEWPTLPGEAVSSHTTGKKLQDPAEKEGIVGAFCRCYSISRAMDELLPGVYTPTSYPDRFTYAQGSTSGGARVFDDKWLYSHHATDPCSGIEVNAWDLVRLHRFGDRDEDTKDGTPVNRLPSYVAMRDFAQEIPEVKRDMLSRQISAADDFGTPLEDDSWLTELDLEKNGRPRMTARNLALIFHNDPVLKGKFSYNQFRHAITANAALPWNDWASCPRDWTDPDDAALRNYFDLKYGMSGNGKINDMFTQVAMEHRTDDVQDYLNALTWDGVKRVDTLLVKYLLAEDSAYTRAVTRKTLVAAVARAMEPGCKFDPVLTLVGAQGIAKSMLVDILGGPWYNDSIQTFTGKEAQEQLRGSWLVEIPEVDRFSTKFDSAIVKQFITRRDDIFRESYGRRTASHPRRCIFIATTNNPEFLVDASGNRRWWLVHCRATAQQRGADMDGLKRDRDQVWAEALELYQMGESLKLPPDLEDAATRLQENAQVDDAWRGMIVRFLNLLIPEDWPHRSLQERVSWWDSVDDFNPTLDGKLVERQTVCIPEIWCECFREDKSDLDTVKSRRIGNILRALGDWEPIGTRPTTAYGNQKTFRKRQD